MMEDVLKSVYAFAEEAHKGQMRKYSTDPYIVHPERVMKLCRQFEPKLEMLAAALLHDVIEDTHVSQRDLSDFLITIMPGEQAEETLRLVIELTDVYVKSGYPHLNRRIRKSKELDRIALTSADAQTIKYADIFDNVQEITFDDPGFAPRYLRECLAILKKADKGNAALRKKALDAVNANLDKL